MIRKKLSFSFAGVLAALFLGSCAAKTPPPALQLQPMSGGDPAAISVAAAQANGLFSALKSGNFSLWQPPPSRQPITEAAFRQMRDGLMKNFGTPVKAEYLGMLDQGKMQDHLWKFRFERQEMPAAGSMPRPHEIIFFVRLIQEKEADNPAVAGFGFKPF